MLLNLQDKRAVNTDYFITVGVGSIKETTGHHVIATLINGQLMSLFNYDNKDAAEAKLEILIKDHNLHHMKIHNDVKVLGV